ncbi:MAG: hypothetical protein U0792_13070 [Gemmataceae bacterium]
MTPAAIPFPFLDAATGPLLFAALVLATFISEDVTCFAAGLLVAVGRADWSPAVAACFVGIALGDSGVWLIGRAAGSRAWVVRRLPASRLAEFLPVARSARWEGMPASRFLPGTRVPVAHRWHHAASGALRAAVVTAVARGCRSS